MFYIHHTINVKIADLSPDGVVLGEAVQQRGAAQAALPLPPEELDVGVDQELGQQHALLDTHIFSNVADFTSSAMSIFNAT